MPAVRGVWLIDPRDGTTPGVYVSLTTDPPGTIVGVAVADFPPKGNDTIPEYELKLQTAFRKMTAYAGRAYRAGEPIPSGWFLDGATLRPMIIDISISLSSLNPITIRSVIITEGAVRQVVVSRG